MSRNWVAGEEVTKAKLNDTGLGLHVVAQDTPNMTVKIFPGFASVAGIMIKYAGGNSPTFTAPVSNPRIDLVYINKSGAIAITAGTEAASPVAPTYPTVGVVLAEIYLRVGATAIYDVDTPGQAYVYNDARPVVSGASNAFRQVGSLAAIDGSVTPVPVAMQSDGFVAPSDADGGSALQKFVGFMTDVLTGFFPTFKYVASTVNTTPQSLTIPAGTNLLLIVTAGEYGAGSLPTGYTFNGVAMTAGATASNSGENEKMWYLPLGTLASPLTANLVRTGGSIEGQVALVYDNVDQASPIQATGTSSAGSDPLLTVTGAYNTIVCTTGGGNPVSVSNAGFTQRYFNDGVSGVKLGGDFQAAGNVTVVFGNGGATTHGIAVALKTATSGVSVPQGTMVMSGIMSGFTGLTPGADYYVSNTAGTISTTAGTTVIKCGKALSATELLIVNS